jgi:hypothetical protein
MSVCGNAGDWWGWIAGAAGLVGSLCLVRPLFILLRHREAMEMIGYALDLTLLDEALRNDASDARRVLARSIFVHRHRWKPWVYSGVGFLGLAMVALAFQCYCLIAT